MKKTILVGVTLATLTIGTGITAAQFTGSDQPSVKKSQERSQSTQETLELTAETNSGTTVAGQQSVETPKPTNGSPNSTPQSVETEEQTAPEVTLLSKTKCSTFVVGSSGTQPDGSTFTNGDPYLHIVSTYSDGSVVVSTQTGSIDTSAKECAGNQTPQSFPAN
jgi:hypothetical protein